MLSNVCDPTGSHSMVGTEYSPLAVGTGTGGESKTTLREKSIANRVGPRTYLLRSQGLKAYVQKYPRHRIDRRKAF